MGKDAESEYRNTRFIHESHQGRYGLDGNDEKRPGPYGVFDQEERSPALQRPQVDVQIQSTISMSCPTSLPCNQIVG